MVQFGARSPASTNERKQSLSLFDLTNSIFPGGICLKNKNKN
jgi:hypothetical protein